MLTREETRAIIVEINSSNNGVRYCYDQATDKLLITANGGLLPEQRALITANRADIVAYMTIPPCSGMCQRGHAIEWKFDASGVWLCACFYQPYALEVVEVPYQRVKEEKKSVKNYWHVA